MWIPSVRERGGASSHYLYCFHMEMLQSLDFFETIAFHPSFTYCELVKCSGN